MAGRPRMKAKKLTAIEEQVLAVIQVLSADAPSSALGEGDWKRFPLTTGLYVLHNLEPESVHDLMECEEKDALWLEAIAAAASLGEWVTKLASAYRKTVGSIEPGPIAKALAIELPHGIPGTSSRLGPPLHLPEEHRKSDGKHAD